MTRGESVKTAKIQTIIEFMDERHCDNISTKMLDKMLDLIGYDVEVIERVEGKIYDNKQLK